VRALLRILEEKGFVKHRQQGTRYVFMPKGSRDLARKSALRRVVETFFGGSAGAAAAALLEEADLKLSEAELEKVESAIKKAKKEGR
jgi:predicted transcriptional regulator